MSECVIGLDIGGTKMAASWVTADGERGPVCRRRLIGNDALSLLDEAVQTIEEAMLGAPGPVRAVGIGVPAILDRSRGMIIWAPNIPAWDSFPLGPEISKALGFPAWIGFDGHMATLGESWLGAGKGVADFVLITLGTGIGGGIISGGKLITGAVGVAGAFGWMSSPGWSSQGAESIGQLEALAAGPGILRQVQRVGPYKSTEEVFDAARQGDVNAWRVIREAAEALGVAMANVVSIVGPELILIGGGISAQADLFLGILKSAVDRHAQPFAARKVRVEKAALGGDAGIVGAAKLALDYL